MAQPTQFTAPNNTEYGGDEVSALVLDPGYAWTRAGFAGVDVPTSIIPTFYGAHQPPEAKEPTYLFGDNLICNALPYNDIQNPLNGDAKEDWVQDWDAASRLWEYSITSRLTTPKQGGIRDNGLNDDPREDGANDVDMEDAVDNAEKPMPDNPLLATEPNKSTAKSREKFIELAMESWGTPAFWLGRTGLLSTFSAGKSTALVIDIGASMMQVTPVFEGMVLKKGVRTSPLAGNFVSSQIRHIFGTAQPPVPLTPRYMVKSKGIVDVNQPSTAEYKKFDVPPMASFRAWDEESVLLEFKECVVQVWEGPGRLNGGTSGSSNIDVVKQFPPRPFEFPDGWNSVFGVDRFNVAEALFDAGAALGDTKATESQTLPSLLKSSIEAVDVDARPLLLSNIVVVGGSSLLPGLIRRLDAEINALFPGPRIRLTAPSNTVERKYASWLGGSILASLGTFHQNWISQKEYAEHGPGIVEKRCK